MVQMTITRVLSEIKMLKRRITKAISGGTFIGTSKGLGDSKKLVNSKTQETIADFEKRVRSEGQQVLDLIDRFEKLRIGLIRTNSSSVITDSSVIVRLGDKTMTIAEAIDQKNIMEYKKGFLHTIKGQYTSAVNWVEGSNYNLDQEIEKALSIAYANDKSKVDAAQYAAIADPRKKEHQADTIDPLKLLDLIKKYEEEIDLFTTELDFVLSEVNARTTIEV
jgi:DNA-directed RNA polymerase beta' subunit